MTGMDFQTPIWICKYMISFIPAGVISILEPTPGQGNLAKALKSNGYRITAPNDFWQISGHWDCIVMNPPFSPMSTGYNILYRCMEMSDIIIALMPWLTIINADRRTDDILSFGLRSVTHLPRNAFQGARAQTCVLEMERGYHLKTEMNFLRS